VPELFFQPTQTGYDIDFTRAIADAVKLPVIASGGAGKLQDFSEAVTKGKASVLLAASVFHFRILNIRQVKEYLRDQGIPVIL
jgi:cyclase